MNGHYDHPVLWNEERRKLEERRIAEEGLVWSKLKRERQKMNERAQQREFREILQKHNPWGKPGGGAPNREIRMTNITNKGLFPESFNDVRSYIPPATAPRIRGGGGGAPIVSDTGRQINTFCDDPLISFKDPTRNIVDIELRYKSTPKMKKTYKMELDKIVEEKRQREMTKDDEQNVPEPWGRKGPGGKPWRDPKNIGCAFLKSMGWTDQKLMKTIDSETHSAFRNPYQKIPSPQDTRKIKEDARRPLRCCNVCNCCCYLRKQMKTAPSDEYAQGLLPPPPPPPPAQLQAINKPKIWRECYKNKNDITPKVTEVRPKQNNKRQKDFRTRSYMIADGVELVPLLAKRRAEQRTISLNTTDVTKSKEQTTWGYGIQYLNELCRQMKRKQKDIEAYKERDVQTSQQHFDTWTSFWGRPGCGAPRDIKNKLNLNDLLYKLPIK